MQSQANQEAAARREWNNLLARIEEYETRLGIQHENIGSGAWGFARKYLASLQAQAVRQRNPDEGWDTCDQPVYLEQES